MLRFGRPNVEKLERKRDAAGLKRALAGAQQVELRIEALHALTRLGEPDVAVGALADAPGNGRTKALVVGGGAAGVVLLLGLTVVVVGRRRRRSTVTVPEGATDQYATLRPSGSAGTAPDAPQPHDEGADQP